MLEGPSVDHAFAAPGAYTVTHTVIDDSGHPCNTASETFEVRVNAEPVAAAGDDRRIAIGEETVLDAGASTDSDGTLVAYEWDFGDGNTGTGPVVRHAYAAPGTYTVAPQGQRQLGGGEQQRRRFAHHHRQRPAGARGGRGQVRRDRPDRHLRRRSLPRQ